MLICVDIFFKIGEALPPEFGSLQIQSITACVSFRTVTTWFTCPRMPVGNVFG